MADAWTNLTDGSTIETGDAWEHLLAQGGGGDTTILLAGPSESNMQIVTVEATVDTPALTAEIAETEISCLTANASLTTDIVSQTSEVE